MDAFRVLTGSRLYEYHNPGSDMDIKGVYILPLYQRLSPLGFVESYKSSSEISTFESDTQEFPLGTKQEISSQELSLFLKHLWNGDINAWEMLMSHRILLDSLTRRSLVKDKNLFLRPNVLLRKVDGMTRNFADQAIAQRNGKVAVHALKSMIFVNNLLLGFEQPCKFREDQTLLLQNVRRRFIDYESQWKSALSVYTDMMNQYQLKPDEEKMNRETLDFVRTFYL